MTIADGWEIVVAKGTAHTGAVLWQGVQAKNHQGGNTMSQIPHKQVRHQHINKFINRPYYLMAHIDILQNSEHK